MEQCLVHIWFSMVVVNVFYLFNKCLLCCFYILIFFWVFQTEQFLHSRTMQFNKRDNLMVMSFKLAGPILVSPRSYIFLHNFALFNRRLYQELLLIQSESVSLWRWRIWNFDIKKDKLVSENYLSGGQAYLEITNIMGDYLQNESKKPVKENDFNLREEKTESTAAQLPGAFPISDPITCKSRLDFLPMDYIKKSLSSFFLFV